MWVWSIAGALKEYKRVYENILAVEKKLDAARKHLVRPFSCSWSGMSVVCVCLSLCHACS